MSQTDTNKPNYAVTGIRDRVKTAREEAKMTQAALAKFLDISRTAVTQWESGLTFPSYDKVIDMARLLHVRPEWIAFGVDTPVEYRIPDDVVKVPVVQFGEDGERKDGPAHYLARTFLAETIRVPVTNDLFVYEIESESFAPRITSGDQLIVDGSSTRVSGEGLFLIWNGLDAQVVSITANPVQLGQVRVTMTAEGFSEEGRHYEAEASQLKVLGRIRGRLSRA